MSANSLDRFGSESKSSGAHSGAEGPFHSAIRGRYEGMTRSLETNRENTNQVKGGELITTQIRCPDDIAPFNHNDQACEAGRKPIWSVP
jgi:hypothetical protein